MSQHNDKQKAIIKNENAFLFFYNWLKLLCLSMFKWENLPDGCDSDYIEKQLFSNGRVIFANHPQIGLINLQLADNYEYDFYDKPIEYTGKAGSFEFKCNVTNSVIVQNNILNVPSMGICTYLADKISKIERIYDVNLINQKTPVIFACSPSEYLTLQNILTNIYNNVPVIKTKENFNLNNKINTLENKVPFILDKLRSEKHSALADALTFFGIKNVNITKKERLVQDEANANNELTEMDLQVFLCKRQECCEQINKLFGTNIKVTPRVDIIRKFNAELEKLENEGGEVA